MSEPERLPSMEAANTHAKPQDPPMTDDLLKKLAVSIGQLPGVLHARPWTRVPMKKRIYVALKKRNRQHCWDLGVGRHLIVYDNGRIVLTGVWAGAMTRDWHARNGTVLRIQDRIQQILVVDSSSADENSWG